MITINENEESTSSLSVKCIITGLFFMVVPEFISYIDSILETALSGMNLALTSGKPMNFIANIDTQEFYEIIYSAQACILMYIFLIGTLKIKGIKKYALKRNTRKKK